MLSLAFAYVQVWLLTLVVLPARANIVVRLGLVVCTALLSIFVLPRQVWMVTSLSLSQVCFYMIYLSSFYICLKQLSFFLFLHFGFGFCDWNVAMNRCKIVMCMQFLS